ncbi:hypothetical protein [Erythrobacter sp. BLCC-B19]|uniref:hypothetical protein n=1 Tax=Erythrobacter sp. BLCC-B19 TaxID=3025315 RepID=UPI0023623AF2|nr:hypothetical protein [Erythrobacter sp. BLCC-B19]WDA41725.1 hypothetical protein PS060_02670 [Erythrobacter sp. BLCC-B19]
MAVASDILDCLVIGLAFFGHHYSYLATDLDLVQLRSKLTDKAAVAGVSHRQL